MVRVLIPSYSQNKSRSGQPFTVYNVDVYWNGRSHSVERRYRDFRELHCDLRKNCRRCLPDFPPKKLRSLSSKVVEERRHLLEVYLQTVASLPMLPRQLVQFLELPSTDAVQSTEDSSDDCDDAPDDEPLSHRPALSFALEAGSGLPLRGALSDVVLKSSLAAFYSPVLQDW